MIEVLVPDLDSILQILERFVVSMLSIRDKEWGAVLGGIQDLTMSASIEEGGGGLNLRSLAHLPHWTLRQWLRKWVFDTLSTWRWLQQNRANLAK